MVKRMGIYESQRYTYDYTQHSQYYDKSVGETCVTISFLQDGQKRGNMCI